MRKAAHNRDQELAFGIQCVDILFFEVDLHPFLLELTDMGQRVYGVSGETGDGLGNDQIDLPRKCVLHHTLEAFALLGHQPRNALVGVYLNEAPFGIALDELRVVAHLCLVARELFLTVG